MVKLLSSEVKQEDRMEPMPVMEKGIGTHPNNFLKNVRVMKGFLKFTSKTKKNKLGGFSTIDPLNMELPACSYTFNCITSQS